MHIKDITHSDKRLLRLIRFAQVAMVFMSLNHIVKAIDLSNLAHLLISTLLIGGAFTVEWMIRLIRSGRRRLGLRLFILLILGLLATSMILEGGLNSPTVVSLPVLMMFAAIYGRMQDNLIACSAAILLTLSVGLSNHYGLLPASTANQMVGHHRLIASIICMILAGYVTWAIGHDIRQAFKRLSDEYTLTAKAKSTFDRLSKTDFLTGLLNTQQAKHNYETLLDDLPVGHSLYFYFIDVDGFKIINDLFDHKAGDELLIAIANVLQTNAPDGASVCRLSGDEFAVFYADENSQQPEHFAQQLLAKISEPLDLYGTDIQVTASIGIASTHRDGFDDIRKKADVAMYRSKRAGKNHYHIHNDAMEREHMKRIYVIQGLSECLQQNDLELHYQPKVDLVSQKVMGMEALIRWNKNNPQKYTPDQFMDVIESTELVHELGDWIIREACIACKSWHQQGHMISMAVNVSVRQLLLPSFAQTVANVLESVGLAPCYLEVELTERFVVKKGDTMEKQLNALRRLGVKVAIDDFGTGYSNISYLTDLEVDVLKLDRSFIQQLQTNPVIQHVVKAIVQIANVMNMRVVAEGIETQADLKAVMDIGCEVGQGYFWAKPMSFDNSLQFLSKDRQTLTHPFCA